MAAPYAAFCWAGVATLNVLLPTLPAAMLVSMIPTLIDDDVTPVPLAGGDLHPLDV
jgi:hypothetical protein